MSSRKRIVLLTSAVFGIVAMTGCGSVLTTSGSKPNATSQAQSTSTTKPQCDEPGCGLNGPERTGLRSVDSVSSDDISVVTLPHR